MARSQTSLGSIADRLKPFGSESFLKPSNKMAFGWDDALLGAGTALSGMFSMFGANKQADTQAAIANAQMAAQADALKQGILMQREQAKGQLGSGMFQTLFGATTAPDIEYGRQLAGQRTQLAELFPKASGLEREGIKWQTAFESDPLFRKRSRQERMGRLQENIAAYRAQPTGMFGRIAQAPIESLMA